MENQIVKPFETRNSERQENDNSKPDIMQLGTTFKSWFRALEELEPRPITRREVYGSKLSDGSGKGCWIITEEEALPTQPKASLLRQILKQEERNYKTLFVPKRGSDELRKVKAPIRELKKLQVMLLRYLYRNSKVADEAHGFVPQRGNWTAAAEIAAGMKSRQRYSILTQDLKQAFNSVTEKQVREVLRATGLKGFALHAATRVATKDGILATGSPSSPHILNLLFKQIDIRLGNWARQQGGKYVRYADDITIALPTWRTKHLKAAREILRRQFAKLGIELHPHKTKITRLGLDSDSAEVIGLATQQQRCTRPKRLRNRLRGLVRSVRKRLAQGRQEEAESQFLVIQGLISYFSGEYKAIREAKGKRLKTLRFAKT